jgi:Kef-type K+ transport system membrane component KefB
VEFHYPPLFLVLIAAACAPMVADATRRLGLSLVVIELLLGIFIGPQCMGWVEPKVGAIPALAMLGMAFLFFVAGLEIDLPAIRGRPLTLAIVGWLGAAAFATGIAFAMRAAGLTQAWIVVAIALVTTALGVLVPIMRDAGVTGTPLGLNVMASGAVGELGPIIVMSIVLSRAHSADVQAGLTLGFIAALLVIAWLLIRGSQVPALLGPLRRGLDSSGQLPIRLSIVLVVALAVLAENFGLDLALGALAAGMMTGLATHGGDRAHELHAKLDAIGFGFLVPIFFLSSGMKLDVRSIFAGTGGFVLLAMFLVALVVVRIPLVLLLCKSLGLRGATATGLFSATTLSLIVVMTQLAVSVMLYPPLALRLGELTRGEQREDTGREVL